MAQDYLKFLDMIRRIHSLREYLLGNSTVDATIQDFNEMHAQLLEIAEGYADYLNTQYKLIWDETQDKCVEGFKNWAKVSISLCAIKILPELQEVKQIEREDFDDLVYLYENYDLDIKLKGTGLYLTAGICKISDAERCYQLQMKAFQIYPDLAEQFDSAYRYEEDKIKDAYYEDCPICGGGKTEGYYCVPQFAAVGTANNFSPVKLWKRCKNCGNLFAYNFPVSDMKNINGHYTKASEVGEIAPRFSLRIYSDIFNKCKQYTDGKKYLEIGIGNGEMLACALEMGFNVDSVEICKEDCENVSAALGVDVKWCDFIEYETEKKYDIIIMGDILEHVSSPVAALKKAKSLLAHGGVLWVSTPNFNSSFSRLRKFSDPMWNQKNHFTYFSYETLLPFLEELNFAVKRYDISNRYNGSMELYCVNLD